MKKIISKIKKFLSDVLAPRYYYNKRIVSSDDKDVVKLRKGFEKMDEAFKKMDEAFRSFWS
jgi:hypothetical protein